MDRKSVIITGTKEGDMRMEKGNILVIGNAGVGKSTLINAVIGKEVAPAKFGTRGTTTELEIYESDNIAFRLIDTIGFEPTFLERIKAINAVKKWGERCAKEGKTDNSIAVIWFCVDGTCANLFDVTIKSLSKATAMWPSVPVIAVITKSYSIIEQEKSIDLIHEAFAKQKNYSKNLTKVIPVVAETYPIDDATLVPPRGISELIEITNSLLPEGIRAAENDLLIFKLKRKKALAQSVVAAATGSAAVVGFAPIPHDAPILMSLEVAEVNGIAHVYDIDKTEDANQFINSIVQAGTVSIAAKQLISIIKAIPGINIGAVVLNSVVAAGIVSAIGEGSIYAFEQVYLGNKTVDDIDWVKKLIESKLADQFVNKITEVLKKIDKNTKPKDIAKIILSVFSLDK